MAKRLTEQDIRRIFREETAREKRESDKLAALEGDVRKTWERLRPYPLLLKADVIDWSNLRASEIDWPRVVQQIIDTYWEVIEEESNAVSQD